MSRRNRAGPSRSFMNGERDSIGHGHVDSALYRLYGAAKKEVAMLTRHFTAEELIPMFFDDDDVKLLTQAYTVAEPAANSIELDGEMLPGYDLKIITQHIKMLPPRDNIMRYNAQRAAPFAEAVREIDDIRKKWYAPMYLLRWFNKNATVGAIRANWPAVLALCPDAPSLKDMAVSPVRYQNPPGLTEMLPLIRETAGTIASLALQPDVLAAPQSNSSVVLTFDTSRYMRAGAEIAVGERWQFFL